MVRDVYKRQDYTPGSMRNSTLEKFKPIYPGLPSSLGTRSHELALFVVLSAPFACLCDSPDEYRKARPERTRMRRVYLPLWQA